ncbi:MAG: TRAP transporter small permease, partial [Synergistaceae bacterium]|nr:TRAP transporter small permease [Synergistaceae bacterium]
MSVIIFMQVIWRYCFRAPLSWSEESARYLFVWISFLGAIAAAKRGNHIGMEMLRNALPRLANELLQFLANMVTVFFFAVTCYYTMTMGPRLWVQFSPATEIPMFFPYFGIAIGSFFMMLYYAKEGVKNLMSL